MPQPAGAGVVPNAEHERHAAAERAASTGHAALLREGAGVVEDLLLRAAEAVGGGVGGRDAGDAERGVLDRISILNVEAADLFQCPRGWCCHW